MDSRIGIRYPEKDVYYKQGMPPIGIFNRDIRWKSYALSDHLGNIRATFSDMKLIDNMYPGFKVDLTSASSFYPFGMEIPGRTWNNGTGYRYGWGGHEKDNEIKGEGNSIATHFRLNDPRTGRWFTTDPVTHFSQSPYVSMDNNPINLFDPNGADVFSDIGDAASSVASWVSDRATEAYEGVKDLLTGTADTPLAPGSSGLIDDVGDALSSISIEAEGIVTYFPPLSNPAYFDENSDYVPGAGYYGENNRRNYFGEEVGPSNYEDFTFNNGFEGFTAGFINSYLFLGLGNAEDLVPPHQRKFFNFGEQTGDYLDYAAFPFAIVKGGVKYTIKSSFKSLTELGLRDGIELTTNEALDAAIAFLGKGYKEVGKNSGRYVSSDGLRQIRIGINDITGAHAGGRHINFETLIPNPKKVDKLMINENYHIFLKD